MSDQKIEVKEDEEQEKKFQEIVELLVAAGYFRARIKGLSPFDKVVGGLTWCIQNCAVEIDVDLLFQENLSIGKKIALTEKIVSVLPRMKCPHAIEPHQIQGMDFINIFPVIQWLVKSALESRSKREDRNRAISVAQFERENGPLSQNISVEKSVQLVDKVSVPKRKLQSVESYADKEASVRVQMTMLEYGSKLGLGQEEKGVSQTENEKAKQEKEEAMLDTMTEAKGGKKKVNKDAISSIMSMKKGELSMAAQQYDQLRQKLAEEQEENNSGVLENKIKILEAGIAKVDQRIKEMRQQQEEATKMKKEIQSNIDEMKAKENVIMKEVNKVTADADKAQKFAKIKKLVATNEKIKKAENDFRAECKKDLKLLQERNSELRAQLEDEAQNEVEEQKAKLALKELRLKLAKRTRTLMTLERKVDSVPSRAELSQYQKRFMELYDQVSAKHTEAQNFFEMYNSLENQKSFMLKEIKLLNDIYEGLEKLNGSARQQLEFVDYLEKVVSGMEEAKQKTELKQQEQERRKQEVMVEQQESLSVAQQYFTLVSRLQQELSKNQKLSAVLNQAD